MSNRRSDTAWEQFGEQDPYFGVLSHDRFRQASREGAAREEFFASGEAHVERIFSIIRQHLDPEFSPRRALDFGCGVGRLVLPFARRVPQVMGIDVSEGMLREARRNCEEAAVHNVQFARSDDQLSGLTGRYDFIHSFIVFQHIPVERGERIAQQLLDRLAEGGIAALHFTYGQHLPAAHRLLQWARSSLPLVNLAVNAAKGRPLRYPHMQMNAYRLNRLFHLFRAGGCHQILVYFSTHGAFHGVFLFARKQSLPGF